MASSTAPAGQAMINGNGGTSVDARSSLPPTPSTIAMSSTRGPNSGVTPAPPATIRTRRSAHHHTQSTSAVNETTRLVAEQQEFLRKIEEEKNRREELELQQARLRSELMRLRQSTATVNTDKDARIVGGKYLSRLERKHQMLQTKLSLTQAENERQKQQVNSLRREKLQQYDVRDKLQREVDSKRQRATTMLRQTNEAVEEKNRIRSEIVTLKQKVTEELAEFTEELNSVKQQLVARQDASVAAMEKMLKSLTAASSPRTSPRISSRQLMERDGGEAEVKATDHLSGTGNGLADMPGTATEGSAAAGQTATEPEGPTVEDLVQQLATLEDMERKIKDATGCRDIEDLVPALIFAEDKNFSMYKDVLQQNSELETLELEKRQLQERIATFSTNVLKATANKSRKKRVLEAQISSSQNQMAKFDSEYMTNARVLTAISESLIGLLREIGGVSSGGGDDVIQEQILSTGLTDRNLQDFLGLLEGRIDAMIQVSRATLGDTTVPDDGIRLASPTGPPGVSVPGLDSKTPALQPPSLPPVQDDVVSEDERDTDDGKSIVPVQVAALHDKMATQVKRMLARQQHKTNKAHRHGAAAGSGAGAGTTPSASATSSTAGDQTPAFATDGQ